jgi:hypothetical protein
MDARRNICAVLQTRTGAAHAQIALFNTSYAPKNAAHAGAEAATAGMIPLYIPLTRLSEIFTPAYRTHCIIQVVAKRIHAPVPVVAS